MIRRRITNHTTALRLGLAALVIANASIVFLHPAARMARGLADGLTGILFGLAIGFLLLSIRLKSAGGGGSCVSG